LAGVESGSSLEVWDHAVLYARMSIKEVIFGGGL